MNPDATWLSRKPQDFVRFLGEQGIRRFFFVTDRASGRVLPSHPVLAPIAAFLERDGRDFSRHEGLFFQVSRKHATLQGAFVHRTIRGQAAGGVRYWRYDTLEDYLRDGLRLSVGMTRKNALAGLFWGGGKGVIAQNPELSPDDAEARASLYREYGEFMTSLRGVYVTAEDVGTRVPDMIEIFSRTRFTTCIPPSLGGSGNPSIPTARGVVSGMEAALTFADRGDLRGKTIAIQGLGNVGAALVGFLLEKGVARIYAGDINEKAVAEVVATYPGAPLEARACSPEDLSILETPCDILAPCATGAYLNARTIPRIAARIVCGAANNQLEDPAEDDRRLAARGVIYVPDFLVNRMGIVTCADEQAGTLPADPLIERHLARDWDLSIYRTALRVLETARQRGEPPSHVATVLADELSEVLHPIFGHRGQAIIDALIASHWQDAG